LRLHELGRVAHKRCGLSEKAAAAISRSGIPMPWPPWRDMKSRTSFWLRSAISAMLRDHCTGSGSLISGSLDSVILPSLVCGTARDAPAWSRHGSAASGKARNS